MARGCGCGLQLGAWGVDVDALGGGLVDLEDVAAAVDAAGRYAVHAAQTVTDAASRAADDAGAQGAKPTPEEMERMLTCAARPWLLRCLMGPPGSPARKAATGVVAAGLLYALWKWG